MCAVFAALLLAGFAIFPRLQPAISHPWEGLATGTGAGNVSCGDALNVTGATYTMNASSAINGSTCFSITAANVVLNCNGYSITGNNTASTYGVISTQLNSTIRNCIISGFYNGIYFNGADNSTIDNVTATITTANGYAFWFASGSLYNLINNSNGNTTSSSVGTSCMFISSNSNKFMNTVCSTSSTSTTAAAIYLNSASFNVITNVSATATGIARGISFYGASSNNVSNSTGKSKT